ncbi:MAG: 50S ribosomal protein L23 [Patescibacteria group bacterium]
MAIFNFGKKSGKTVGGEVKAPSKSAPKREIKPIGQKDKETLSPARANPLSLLSPRLTEKGMGRTESSVYCFNVAPRATKKDIALAFKDRYGVLPEKVRVVPTRGKKISVRGIPGQGASGKKAYVYTPEGTKIEFV